MNMDDDVFPPSPVLMNDVDLDEGPEDVVCLSNAEDLRKHRPYQNFDVLSDIQSFKVTVRFYFIDIVILI